MGELATKSVHIGIHSVAFRNRSTGELYGYGEIEVMGDFSINPNPEMADLLGGSRNTKWKTAQTGMNPEISLVFREFPDAAYQVALGATINRIAASATSGTVSALANKTGVSVFDAVTGIATVTAKTSSESDMKTGFYVVKAFDATTVDVFYLTTLEKAKEVALTIQDESDNKITAAPLTITATTAVEIPNTGLELTGGSGIIALVASDTAIYHVYAPHGGVVEAAVGAAESSIPTIELIVCGKDRDSGEMMLVQVYCCKSKAGLSNSLARADFSEAEMTFDAFYDEAQDGIYKAIHIKPVA